MLLDLLRSWFTKQLDPIRTRLTQDDVLAIARSAAPDHAEELVGDTVDNGPGGVTWTVSTATIGSWVKVRIDDSIGTVIDVRRVGVR